jgi:class 3 adenylate cyclase
MSAMNARPSWLPVIIAGGAGLLALVSPELGVIISILGLVVPVLAVNPIVGIILGVVLFSAERFLGGGKANVYLLIALAVIGAYFGPVWAAAALAGYLLGASEGALAATAACLAVELLGVLTARASIGVTATGGQGRAALAFAHSPNLLSLEWVSSGFKSIGPAAMSAVGSTFGHIGNPVALLLQIAVWATAAVVAGVIMQRVARPALWVPLLAVSAGVGVAWAGDMLIRLMFRTPGGGAASMAAVTSLAVALAFVIARELVFAPLPAAKTAEGQSTAPASMATEDADVDELLRLISSAEDKLASKHTAEKVVLITDMKSFSRITEEDGSMATAKAIQRHRDILVPVIIANHGHGKSTGGDGVVAAFDTPQDAIRAAVESQQALSEYNASHPDEREIWVRMGLASGEVVLDNGGRPFIGAGLNLAARVMNLADGGQVFATAAVASAAAAANVRAAAFGPFELKNIANPVEVAELLWADDQTPKDPREQRTEG